MLWIGGAPGSGKTTIARRIARRHGLRWYNADAHTWEHRDRALRERNPAALRWEAMTPEERWVETTPEEMVDLSLTLQRWPMIADDLRGLPASPLVVAEGSTVLPELVTAGIADPSRAVWLFPTSELARARIGERHRGPAESTDEERARENMTQLWLLVGDEIARRVDEVGVTRLDEDGSRSVDQSVAAVEALFAQALPEGPVAQSPSERRALLRYANDAVVSQALQYLARPWSSGDAESFIRTFVCECDDVECDEVLELAVATFQRAAEAGPVLADVHG